MSEQIDTIVRFHDMSRLTELGRCVFSLAEQTYRPLHIILAVQRFSEDDVANLEKFVIPLLEGHGGLDFTIVNWREQEPKDARAALFNIGISAATGRYLAFLDYDDVLYPEAYALLINRLKRTDSGIAFASVRSVMIDVFKETLFTREQSWKTYRGRGLADLLRGNFCPLHSYVMDRDKVPAWALLFDPSITLEEDYDMLLRVVAHVPSNFDLLGTEIGLYAHKTDGSNTVTTLPEVTEEWKSMYRRVEASIESRRTTTTVTEPIQRTLGLSNPEHRRTIREVIDAIDKRGFLTSAGA